LAAIVSELFALLRTPLDKPWGSGVVKSYTRPLAKFRDELVLEFWIRGLWLLPRLRSLAR
jgi:hypothetical protein